MPEDNVRAFRKPAKKVAKKAAAKKAPAKQVAPKRLSAADRREAALQAERDAHEAQQKRLYDASAMRLSGKGWRDVAAAFDFASDWAAMNEVNAYRDQAARERAEDQRAQAFNDQLDRYMATLSSWWTKANEELDANAATVVLRTMAQLDKLHRLGEPDAAPTVRAIVIAGSPEEYAAQLRAHVLEREGARALPPAEN